MKYQGGGGGINSPYTNVLSSNSNYNSNQLNYKINGIRQQSNLPTGSSLARNIQNDNQKKVNSSMDQYNEQNKLTPLQQKYLDKLDSIYGSKGSNQQVPGNQISGNGKIIYNPQNSNVNTIQPFSHNNNNNNHNSNENENNQQEFFYQNNNSGNMNNGNNNGNNNNYSKLPNLNIKVNGSSSFLERNDHVRKSNDHDFSSINQKNYKKFKEDGPIFEGNERNGKGNQDDNPYNFEGNSRFPKIDQQDQINYHYIKAVGNHQSGVTTDKENRDKYGLIKEKYSNYGKQNIFSDNAKQKEIVFNQNQKLNELLMESRTTPQKTNNNQIELTPIPQKYAIEGGENNLQLPQTGEKNDLLYSPAHSSGNKDQMNNNNTSVISKFAMRTKAGCTINRVAKTNQDSPIVNPQILADLNINLFCVCDGHGLNGHLVSQMIKKSLPKNIQKFLKEEEFRKTDTAQVAISKGFAITNNEVLQADFDTNLSGSTVVTVLINERKLYCANVGDSRAIIGTMKGGEIQAIPLSYDQKPDVEIERQRIIQNGGRVDAQRDFHGNIIGPMRVWLQTVDMPGLAMTRSFGDKVGVQAGVISEPEILEFDISHEDLFMVVASDGVWEYMSNQDQGLAEQAAEQLVNEAIQVWKRESYARDDITAIVVFFNRR